MADRDFTPPEFRDGRYRSTALNGGNLLPNRVGAKFTPAEMATLVAWLESQGLWVGTRKPTGIHVIDNTNCREPLDLNAYDAPGLKADRDAQRQQAERDRIEAQRQEDRAAFAAAASRAFTTAAGSTPARLAQQFGFASGSRPP